jgi:hypothetical protein
VGRCALAVGAALALASGCKGSAATDHAPAPGAVADAGSAVPVAAPVPAIVATCADAIGTVEVRRTGQATWEPVRIGATFRERDWVRTGAGGFARVRFADRGFVDLPENAAIVVDTAIRIESGTLVAVAEAGAPILVRGADGSEARIVAAAGAAAAELRLTPSATGLEIAVTKGNVTVIARDGEQAVAAGEASDLANHRAGAVVKLLGYPRSLKPEIDARFQFIPDTKIGLAWGQVRGAVRYRVQVARDTGFHARVLDVETTATTATFVPDGIDEYAWRVAGIDAEGRLGEFGFVRRIYLEEEAPSELLISPADGARIGFATKTPRVTFSWRSSGDTKRYKLVIGRGADLTSSPVVAIATSRQQLEVQTLREGRYRWGVFAVRGERETPIFLEPRALTIRKQRVKAHTEKLWQDAR